MTEADPSHFYEVAFVGLGTLEAICFGVHGLLYTVYSQYMTMLTLPDNPNPPPVTGEIVWICRGLTFVIVLSGLAAIPSLFALPGVSTLTAQVIRAVLVIVLVSLALTALAIVRRMKVPKRGS
jgi:hypothetical protein